MYLAPQDRVLPAHLVGGVRNQHGHHLSTAAASQLVFQCPTLQYLALPLLMTRIAEPIHPRLLLVIPQTT